jgi:AraC-like DNA-binding protein
MSTTAFTTASGFGPLPRLLKDMAGPAAVRRVFQKTGLPLDLIDNRTTHIPIRDMIALFSQAAIHLGDADFGLRVGAHMSAIDFGTWARYVSAAQNLGAMLERATKALVYHQTGSEFKVEKNGPSVRWSYTIKSPFAENPQPCIDHTLQPMISLVRLYAGLKWRPSAIEVAYSGSSRRASLENAFEVPIYFTQHTTSLVIERELLSSPQLTPSATLDLVTFGDLRRMVMSPPPRSTAEKARSIVQLRARSGCPDIETVAAELNTSVRTLQRELGQDGTRFRDVVQQARFSQAVRLVAETCRPFEDISREIGYSDPANFTRAFQHASGMPPSVYRKLHYRESLSV